MKTAKSLTLGIAAALVMVGTVNADISYSISSTSAIFIAPSPNALPVDSWYQVWWSIDAITIADGNSGDVQVGQAQNSSLGSQDTLGSGDYLVAQGGTPGAFGFVPTQAP
ncbi:MAG: hypothetical protein OSB41_13210, partial [Kiritimatiellae bacterium]|nr:hypothetical protein [Kiritimatiellia bacterium]